MKLYAVRLFTTDWDRAVDFYQETIGLPLLFAGEEFDWAEFDIGGARLGVEGMESGDERAADLVGRFVGVSLGVPDIHFEYARLVDRGVEFIAPPEKRIWGGTVADFKDPDGNVLTLLEL